MLRTVDSKELLAFLLPSVKWALPEIYFITGAVRPGTGSFNLMLEFIANNCFLMPCSRHKVIMRYNVVCDIKLRHVAIFIQCHSPHCIPWHHSSLQPQTFGEVVFWHTISFSLKKNKIKMCKHNRHNLQCFSVWVDMKEPLTKHYKPHNPFNLVPEADSSAE